jgi:hypothetical protein
MLKCEFPNCNYETDCRNKIHLHHIVPKELGGNNQRNNLIYLCPNCHSKIYIENSKSGNHSIQATDSIILISKLLSTNGNVLHFKKCSNQKNYFYFYNLKEEVLSEF